MADVFLSYARASEASAERIAEELGTCGFSVWFDRESYLPISPTPTSLKSNSKRRAFGARARGLSRLARSQWVRSEANRA